MGRTPYGRWAIWILGLLWMALPGCTSWTPWRVATDTVPGLTPPHERIAALRRLAAAPSKDPSGREAVASQLAADYAREGDPLIRAAMIQALAAHPGPVSASTLREAAKDSSADVRIAVCRALARQRGPEASALLREVFASDVDVDVRLAAARALGETGDPAAIATLGAALEDRDPAVQYRAVAALRKIAPQDLGNDVERWRQYVQGQTPSPPREPTVAGRLRRMLY